MSRPLLLAAVLSLGSLGACHIRLHDHMTVDGVRLRFHHQEVLTLEAWPSEGLTIAAHQGDVRAEAGDGPITITVEVHEREPLAAHAHVENGRLVARAENGAACGIGRVVLRARGPVRGLELTTGCGDVELDGLAVEGKLRLSSGVGDLDLRAAGQPDSIDLSTGTGDVSVADARCSRLDARTGVGDVRVEELEAAEVELSTGVGDVDVARSKGSRVKADTGVGDIELVESSFENRDLDTGLGGVRAR
jgi:DUF4097 and DUF4098 domain-containing protein YvlB